MGSILRSSGAIIYARLHFNLRLGFNGLIYMYSGIVNGLPAITKLWIIDTFVDVQIAISRILGDVKKINFRKSRSARGGQSPSSGWHGLLRGISLPA